MATSEQDRVFYLGPVTGPGQLGLENGPIPSGTAQPLGLGGNLMQQDQQQGPLVSGASGNESINLPGSFPQQPSAAPERSWLEALMDPLGWGARKLNLTEKLSEAQIKNIDIDNQTKMLQVLTTLAGYGPDLPPAISSMAKMLATTVMGKDFGPIFDASVANPLALKGSVGLMDEIQQQGGSGYPGMQAALTELGMAHNPQARLSALDKLRQVMASPEYLKYRIGQTVQGLDQKLQALFANLSPEQKAHLDTLKKDGILDYNDLYAITGTLKTPDGAPYFSPWEREVLRSEDPRVESLVSQHGIITPKMAKEITEAKLKEKERLSHVGEDLGNYAEIISKSKFKDASGKGRPTRDLKADELAQVKDELKQFLGDISAEQGAAQLKYKRLDEASQQALTGVDLMKRVLTRLLPKTKENPEGIFTVDELNRFTGPVENWARQAAEFFRADPRFDKFMAILNQQIRGQFEIAGKAFTGTERELVQDALPMGREKSVQLFIEKVMQALDTLDSIRYSRLHYGTTGVEELKQEERQKMLKRTKPK